MGSLPANQPLAPGVTLEILGSQGRQIRWRMNRVLTLAGREAGCQLKTPDPDISPYHCSLLHTPLGVWVIDLLSHTGTFLNGQRIRWARLGDGDRLQLGSYCIRPWYDEEGWPATGSVTPTSLPAATSDSVVSSTALPEPGGGQLIASGSRELTQGQDALLLPLMDQMQLMQQQMFDQFQQTMVLMVQMFGTMHREQMGLLREELDKVHRLTREVEELQAELRKKKPGVPAALPVPRSAKSPDPVSTTTTTVAIDTAQPESAVEGGPSAPAVGLAAAVPLLQEGDPTADASIHTWLRQRIDALNAERQGLWQKILDFVKGR
jgi:hypothetical protein